MSLTVRTDGCAARCAASTALQLRAGEAAAACFLGDCAAFFRARVPPSPLLSVGERMLPTIWLIRAGLNAATLGTAGPLLSKAHSAYRPCRPPLSAGDRCTCSLQPRFLNINSPSACDLPPSCAASTSRTDRVDDEDSIFCFAPPCCACFRSSIASSWVDSTLTEQRQSAADVADENGRHDDTLNQLVNDDFAVKMGTRKQNDSAGPIRGVAQIIAAPTRRRRPGVAMCDGSVGAVECTGGQQFERFRVCGDILAQSRSSRRIDLLILIPNRSIGQDRHMV